MRKSTFKFLGPELWNLSTSEYNGANNIYYYDISFQISVNLTAFQNINHNFKLYIHAHLHYLFVVYMRFQWRFYYGHMKVIPLLAHLHDISMN